MFLFVVFCLLGFLYYTKLRAIIIMALCSPEENLSDEEIFFGKLTLKEVKKRILLNTHSQSISCTAENFNVSNDSVKIIETCSEPDVYSVENDSLNFDSIRPSMNWDVKSNDDSFLRLEKMVTELSELPKNEKEELDNTLEVVEFILTNTPVQDDKIDNLIRSSHTQEKKCLDEMSSSGYKETIDKNFKAENGNESKSLTELQTERLYNTPVAKHLKVEQIKVLNPKTPEVNIQPHHNFKTPKNPVPFKSCFSSTKKTLNKIDAFQHITSPVASYIKNCPQTPLLRDVHPKKPLPGCSNIPKLVKNTSERDKEKFALPSVAYKSAKKTKMITIPDKEKLPQNQWAKKIGSTIKKPLVIKHDHREINSNKKPVINEKEDSFANLSLHQADLSVCTQKSAFSNPIRLNNNIE